MTKQKYFRLLLILVTMALLGSLIYVIKTSLGKTDTPLSQSATFDQTPTDQTTNWKVYESSVYQISFKYPPNWYINTASLADIHPDNKTVLQVTLTSNPDTKNKELLGNTTVQHSLFRVWGNKERKQELELFNNIDAFFNNTESNPSKWSKDIKGNSWIVRQYKNNSGVYLDEYSLIKGDLVYQFITSIKGVDSFDIEQMVETFRVVQ